jgi:pimeloyl-ACP methyl ester carboxylesterase
LGSKAEIEFRGSDDVLLKGCIYEPSQQVVGTLQFVHGWTSQYKEYASLLEPLSERYRIVAFNLRGHGGSQGIFDRDKCVEDVVGQNKEYCVGPTGLLGHSAGSFSLMAAEKCNYRSMAFFTPYLCPSFLPKGLRALVKFLDISRATSIINKFEDGLKEVECRYPWLHRKYLNVENLARNSIALNDMDLRSFKVHLPLLYFLSDKDGTLGTDDPTKHLKYKEVLQSIADKVIDCSEFVCGLNHNLNFNDSDTFLKEEPGKNKERILRCLDDFFSSTLQPA